MKNKIIVITTLLAGMFILNSCLKDDNDYWKDDVKGKQYITFLKPGFTANSLLPVADPVEVKFMVNIASDKLPKTDNVFTFALDNAAISAYDSTLKKAAIEAKDTLDDGTLNWKNYKPWPSVKLLDETLTIPAGSRVGFVRLLVDRADTVKLLGNYMTAITITSSPANVPIANNMKTILCAFPIANKYEGDYASEGFRDHPVNGIEPFKYAKIHFSTVNANTVQKDRCGNYGGYLCNITITTNVIVVNGVDCYKCNVLCVPGSGGDPGATQGMYNDYNGDVMNYYNPVTKVFELYYWYGSPARKLRETNSKL